MTGLPQRATHRTSDDELAKMQLLCTQGWNTCRDIHWTRNCPSSSPGGVMLTLWRHLSHTGSGSPQTLHPWLFWGKARASVAFSHLLFCHSRGQLGPYSLLPGEPLTTWSCHQLETHLSHSSTLLYHSHRGCQRLDSVLQSIFHWVEVVFNVFLFSSDGRSSLGQGDCIINNKVVVRGPAEMKL